MIVAIRNHPEARWLPSRHRLALFRLYALLRLMTAKPQQTDVEFVLPIDRDQSAHEQYTVALWIYVTAVAYVAALLPLITPVAIIVAMPIAAVALHVPLLLAGIALPRWTPYEWLHAKVLMTVLGALSLWFVQHDQWPRFIAWFFLGALALNGFAAVIVFALRGMVRRIERPYREGAAPFAI
ncbi:MAG TPA: hypothetical protein VN605_04125, partial [Thermoanaerobaculia bacterium]|nr:hypothetical protein [Thermoanaerobaculia bacterium]